MEQTLDLGYPKARDNGLQQHREPLKNFRRLAVANGLISRNDDLGVLRKVCLEIGLTKACWRFLNRYDEGAYAAIIPIIADDEHLMDAVLQYLCWQSAAGLQKPLAGELGRRYIFCLGGYYDPDVDVDPRIARVADDHWARLKNPDKRAHFSGEEWVRVLNWMRDERPSFDRNQWRSGWNAIYRRYQKWQKLNPDRLAWRSLVTEFDQDGLHIQPLTSSFALAREGERMGNCMATYAKYCLSGNYRLFSISDMSSRRVVATIGLVREDGYWKIDQIKGRFNRDPEPHAARLGRVLQQKYIRAEELIDIEETLEYKRRVQQLREEHLGWSNQKQALPPEAHVEFNREEFEYLEKNAARLGALASGALRPHTCEQVRFIAVSNGIVLARTQEEKIWKRYQRLCHATA